MKSVGNHQKRKAVKKFAILAAVVALIGCTQNDEGLDNITNIPSKSLTEFYASMPECDTRTYVEDNKYLRWNADDEITVFAGNSYNSHWQFAGENGANNGKFNEINEGGFVTGTPLDLTANYAIYPYNENITITEAGVVSLTLPAVQAYNHTYANSFGEGANTMMAVTKSTADNFLSFKNLCGYLKLKFYGENVTVKSVTVKGNNGEKIAGKATVSMAYGGEPTIIMGDDATDTITIDCGEGVALSNDAANPTIFWVVIPEITFEGGITIEVTDINDQTFSKQTTNAVPIENNLIQPMAVLRVEVVPAGPANNEIWYTATEKVEPYSKTVFGANIVSNEWNSTTGEGVITFDGEVTKIGDSAFNMCYSLNSINIPNSVVEIEGQPFEYCRNIEAFYGKYASEDYNCLIIDGTLKMFAVGCNTTIFSIPENVNIIDKYAFLRAKNITDIIIGDNVKVVGKGAFYGCENLANLTFGKNITVLEGSSFCDCRSLTNVVIPDNIVEVGDHAFQYCKGLIKVIIGTGVTHLGTAAFDGCTSLVNVYCKPITPPSVGVNVFYDHSDSLNIYIPYTSVAKYISSWGVNYEDILVAYDFDKNEIVQQNNEIWYTATSKIEPYKTWAFSTNVSYGTEYVSNEWDRETGKGVMKFNGNLTSIADEAFYGRYNLTSITIPNSVTWIGDKVFDGCTALTSFYGKYASSDNRCLIIDGSIKAVAPAGLTECTIPDSVTSIREGAFGSCTSLTRVNISDLSAWCKISFGNGSANPLHNEAKLYLNGSELTDITIPSDITEIKAYAFYYCSSLTSVTIPNSVTTIGNSAFGGCQSLTSVTIGDRVTSIGNSAFYQCQSLTSVSIGDRVTSIGSYAFCYCSSLKEVYCKPTTPPTGGYRMFSDFDSYSYSYIPIGCKIYVHTASVEAYKAAGYWSDYASCIEGYDFGDDEESGSGTDGGYTVALNNAWRKSTSVSNPNSSTYDGVYESNSNYNVNSNTAIMYIDINGYTEFSFYVRSYAESNYDYVMVSQLDKSITGSTSYSDTTLVKAHTRGNQKSGSSIYDYTKVTYSNISSGTHLITIVYRKDSSQHSGADRGYVIIPKNQ